MSTFTEFSREPIAKVCGADVELANFIVNRPTAGDSAPEASRRLLREVDGVPGSASSGYWGGKGGHNPQDWGRKWLRQNGACVYIDLDHLEVCLPETISPFDHLAAWHAMLAIAESARQAANQRLSSDEQIEVIANNTDGQGNSYGSHLNFLMRRDTWEDLFHYKPHLLQFIASHQVSSIVYCGAGKVGGENGRGNVDYQISQRADFIETLCGQQTTYRRPVVNSRDEALCGVGPAESERALARLHVIFYDSTLCHVSTALKVGVMQIVLAMTEAGCISPEMLVEHPVRAVARWSRDPALRHAEPMVSGKRWTAVELQSSIHEKARAFVDEGRCAEAVPHAHAILNLWAETLDRLSRRDFDALADSLDWVLKRFLIEQALDARGEDWDSPTARVLDQQYANLDPASGLYRSIARQGIVRQLIPADHIDRFTREPPEDTRAWARAMILRSIDPGDIYSIDWDRITYAGRSGRGWPETKSVLLDDPRRYGRAELRPRQNDSHEQGTRQRAAESLALDTEV